MKNKKRGIGKKGVGIEMIIWVTLAILALAFSLYFIWTLKNGDIGWIEKLKNLFKFGR